MNNNFEEKYNKLSEENKEFIGRIINEMLDDQFLKSINADRNSREEELRRREHDMMKSELNVLRAKRKIGFI